MAKVAPPIAPRGVHEVVAKPYVADGYVSYLARKANRVILSR